MVIPTNPVSSPIMASIESVETFGKYLFFCSEFANPFPNVLPEPMAIIICSE